MPAQPEPLHALLTGRRSRLTVGVISCVAAASSVLVASQAADAAVTELAVNGGFESGATGWFASSGTTLSIVGGHTGARAARVANPSTSAKTVALNDAVNTVHATVKGQTYSASAYVRLTQAGSKAGIRLMEYTGNTLNGQRVTQVVFNDTAWHQVTVSYTAATSGATLDLNVLGWALPAGTAVDVDDVSASAPVTSTPTPAPATPTPPAPAPGWTQVWGDEFNGSSVDTGKWRVLNNEHHSNELSCVTSRASNVSASGGVLHITARRENYQCGSYAAGWTSGYLDTIGKLSQTYGRFEMRAKLPTTPGSTKGMWPAFWLRPSDGGDGEIDIMEAIGSGPGEKVHNDVVSQTLWYDYHGTYPRQTFGGPVADSAASFHTYGVEWEPGVIRWYVDGVNTYTRNATSISWINANVFKKPYNIRLNLQVGGSWPGSPTSATAATQDYQVDYVRVYKR